MYRNNTPLVTDHRMNFVFNHGAMGDMICSLPPVVRARQMYPKGMTLILWVPPWQLDLIKYLLAPYGEFDVRSIVDFPLKLEDRENWDGGPIAMNSLPFNTHTRNRAHMVDYAYACLLDSTPNNMDERSYPTGAPLDAKHISGDYVVFPVGATSDNKLFKASVMVPILEWCISNRYRPVLVGTKTSHTAVQYGGGLRPVTIRDEVALIPQALLAECLDYRERTSLIELRDILGHASATVGVDGGTIHLAGTTHAPIVYGLTTTLPKHRYIPRQGSAVYQIKYVGPRDLECAGCQSNWSMTRFDFTKCPYEDNACTDLLHPDDFINALKELGL